MMGGSIWSRKRYLKMAKEPKPPYTEDEVPLWWPQWLRTYLTKVSPESFYGLYPCIIEVPKDPNLTLEQTRALGREQALKNIEDDGGPEQYFKHELERCSVDILNYTWKMRN